MTVSLKYDMMACSANQNLLLFQIKDKGKDFEKLFEMEVDQTFKNPTIVKANLSRTQYVSTTASLS
jgi:hypothetical protein